MQKNTLAFSLAFKKPENFKIDFTGKRRILPKWNKSTPFQQKTSRLLKIASEVKKSYK